MFSLTPWKKRDLAVRREDEHPIAQFRREMDAMWDRLWKDWERGLVGWENGSRFAPLTDLEDQEKGYVLRAELPGFEPNEIDVSVSGNVLTVRAEHRDEQKAKTESSYRYGRFQESFTLPQGVVSNQIDARYHSGVLEVHLPKSEESRPKKIAVKSE